MSLTVGYLHLRLFLEGIEVPVVSAVVSGTKNQPIIAQIQIVPTPMAFRIAPRTKVDLFFYDLYGMHGSTAAGDIDGIQFTDRLSPVIPETSLEAEAREGGGVTRENLDVPQELMRYRLLFTGEVIVRQYVKRSTSRAVVLQCMGNSSYWDLLAADQRGGMLFGGSRRSTFAGMTQAPFWDLLAGNTGEVFEKLTQPPTSFPNLTGFTAGLLHCMEAIFGVFHRRTSQGHVIAGSNQFLALANLRLRLMQQLGVAGGDDSPLRLMRNQAFGTIWRPALRGLPRYFGFRHLLQALMPYTFYEHIPVLAPRYTPPTGIYASYMGWEGYSTGFLRTSPEWAWIVNEADRIKSVCVSWLDGELADIAHEAQEEGFAELEGLLTSRLAGDLRNTIGAAATTIVNGTSQERVEQPDRVNNETEATVYTRREALRRLESVNSWAGSIRQEAVRLAVRLESGRTSLPGNPDHEVTTRLKEIVDTASRITNYAMPPPSRRDDDSESEPAHLYCDVLAPDVWFCAPPRTNVLFPDQILGMEFARDFQKEATRLLVRSYDKWLGSDYFFDKWWIAPSAAGLFTGESIMRGGRAMSRIRRDIMDHELMTGIVPLFQKLSDREMYLGSRVAGYGSNPASAATSDQKRYFQAVTNFLLFRTRFQSRTLSVSTVFNPYLILGFPAVMLDPSVDSNSVALNQEIINAATESMQGLSEDASSVVLELIKNRTGTHYLGVIHQLVHTANASGENCGTSIVLSYAREHNEKIEYMGQDSLRLAQGMQQPEGDRTIRRRSPAVDQLIREYQILLAYLMDLRSAGSSTGAMNRSFGPSGYGALSGGPGAIRGVDGSTYSTDGRTLREVEAYVMGQMNAAYEVPMENVTVTVSRPPTKTSTVFALREPDVRVGSPPADTDVVEGEQSPESAVPGQQEYLPGASGPNGGEIIEAYEITDQYRGRTRPINTSGWSEDVVRQDQRVLEDYEVDARNQAVDRQYADASSSTDGDQSDRAARAETEIDELDSTIASRNARIEEYNSGWRQQLITLPFMGTGVDGRRRPVTSITTDKIGVPFDARELPELMSLLGVPSTAPYMVTLRVYAIVEDMTLLEGGVYDMAAEDILRPPWYSNVWLNRLIGGGVYQPLFGTGSIVDPIAVMNEGTQDVFRDLDNSADAVNSARAQIRRGGDGNEVMSGILEGASIENAVDYLAQTYLMTKREGYDLDSFIKNYTYRPVATMFDMYGSGDLTLDQDGRNAVAGVEGFHSRAFGPYSNLFGLVPFNDIRSMLGITEDDPQTAARVDVRGRRYALVQAYRLELLNLRGCAVA